MGIDWSKIQAGDIFFTANKSPLGALIRWATKSKVQHVGQFIQPYVGSTLFYRCEMVLDPFSKQDFKIANPIKEKEIIAIKRPMYAYKTDEDRAIFTHRMIKWHEKNTIGYDLGEFFSHTPILGSGDDKNKKKMICSRLVYVNLCLDSSIKVETEDLNKGVTPEDIYSLRCLTDVVGWRK